LITQNNNFRLDKNFKTIWISEQGVTK